MSCVSLKDGAASMGGMGRARACSEGSAKGRFQLEVHCTQGDGDAKRRERTKGHLAEAGEVHAVEVLHVLCERGPALHGLLRGRRQGGSQGECCRRQGHQRAIAAT